MRTLALTALLLAVADAQAQTTADTRWTPFVGCWDLVSEDLPDSGPGAAREASAPRGRTGARRSARVCVEPQGAGVSMTTTVGEQPALTQSIVPGTSPRPITDDTCRGTESAEWSSDGLRLFSRAVLTCPGEPERSVSGIMLPSSGGWIDVQAVAVGGRERVRVRHYRRSATEALQTTRLRTSAVPPISVEGVIEASRKVSGAALEAALIESRARFTLSGKTLLALDRAGVSDGVTDLMVALSYPDAFVVERAAPDDRLTSVDAYGYMNPWDVGDRFGSYFPGGLSGAYFDSGYYYSPFGYSYLRAYPLVFGGFGEIVSSGPGSFERSGRAEPGRVIDGLGYTRVTPTRAAGTPTANNEQGSARSGSSRTRGSTQGAVDSGSGSGSAGSTSSGGSSTGAAPSPADTGRTAVPR